MKRAERGLECTSEFTLVSFSAFSPPLSTPTLPLSSLPLREAYLLHGLMGEVRGAPGQRAS